METSGRTLDADHGLELGELLREKIFSFDTQKYGFLSVLHKIFGVNDLSKLHELVPESSEPSFLDFQNDQGTWFHKTYYKSPFLQEMLAVYRTFIFEVVAPQFKSNTVVYQAKPTFRYSVGVFSHLISMCLSSGYTCQITFR